MPDPVPILSLPMKQFDCSPFEIFASAWRNRELIAQMTRREVVGRYRGSMLGIVWSFFNPVLMLAVYTFVFSIVFKARWQAGSDSKTEFAIVLFAGMIVFGIFSECINRAPSLVLGNPNYVKKIVFPLEVMPWVSLGSALFHAVISLAVLLLFSLVVNQTLPWTVLLLPAVVLPLILLVLGLGWFLGALGVFLRDVSQTVGLATTVLMFLSPVFYPLTALPEEFRQLLLLNPLALIIESARDVLIWGRAPAWQALTLHGLFSLLVAWLGFVWFQKTRKGFGDVL